MTTLKSPGLSTTPVNPRPRGAAVALPMSAGLPKPNSDDNAMTVSPLISSFWSSTPKLRASLSVSVTTKSSIMTCGWRMSSL